MVQGFCVACDGKIPSPNNPPGTDVLNDHAINGFSGEAMTPMLPKGGRPDLTDQEVYDAVEYMVSESQ